MRRVRRVQSLSTPFGPRAALAPLSILHSPFLIDVPSAYSQTNSVQVLLAEPTHEPVTVFNVSQLYVQGGLMTAFCVHTVPGSTHCPPVEVLQGHVSPSSQFMVRAPPVEALPVQVAPASQYMVCWPLVEASPVQVAPALHVVVAESPVLAELSQWDPASQVSSESLAVHDAPA